MNPETRAAFELHAVSEYPQECCGVVCVIKGRERFLPCRNIADQPAKRFVIAPEDFASAEDMGEVIAIAHSHPNASARASEADLVMCEATEVPWHIVSVATLDDSGQPAVVELVTIEPSGYEAPLVGRQFFHGVLDCYSLVRDHYKRVLNIELPHYERADGWWDRGENLYLDHFAEAGFSEVTDEPREHDLFLMEIRSPTPNHAAIYLGDGRMLHHLHGRLSSRDVYGGYWQEATRLTVRHKDLK